MHLGQARGVCGCNAGFSGLGADLFSIGAALVGRAVQGGGGSAQPAAPSNVVSTSVNTQVSPQISPVFVQQDSPVNSPVNASPAMTPAGFIPVTGNMPGFDYGVPSPYGYQRAAGPNWGVAALAAAALFGIVFFTGRKQKGKR